MGFKFSPRAFVLAFTGTLMLVFTASLRGVIGMIPKWPQLNVVSSSDGKPNAHLVMPSRWMIGWKSMIHSCSLETGISRPSAIR